MDQQHSMTPQDFLLKIISAYEEARLTGTDHPKIRRGRSHSISSQAEDYLAEYLVQSDPSLDLVLVDQPVTLSAKIAGTERAVQRYPDLVLIRNGTIETLIDLKMDLGWARTKMREFCEKHETTLDFFAGQTGRLKDGRTKETREYEFSKKLRYIIAVISGQNINQDQLKTQLGTVREFEPRVTVLVLSNGVHPNAYEANSATTLSRLEINTSAFKFLTKSHT
ncbi:MAG: hypothetical protein AAGA30_09840 [Planctomycetota bacterium]